MQIEINDHELVSDEARTRRAEEYLHRKAMENIAAEDRWTRAVVNTAVAAAVAAVLTMVAMAIHAYITVFN
jgi:ABC-type sulfate transport system permease component